jgi:hypothetical protein
LREQQKAVRQEKRAKGDDAKGNVHREVYLSKVFLVQDAMNVA